MRHVAVAAALTGLAALLPACVPVYVNGVAPVGVARIDPEEAGERALIGSAAGAALGTGLGAVFAINPAIGAVIGVESGAAIGAAIGVATTQPLPAYRPIAAPAAAVIPGFYDGWPPGYHNAPTASSTPPPPS